MLSVVVVIYNMERQARRTLLSLAATYQQRVAETDYEVIVVDNGSTPPFPSTHATGLGANFRYFYIDDASRSPAPAMNFGVRQARGTELGLIVDGARIVTPRLLDYAIRSFAAFDNPVSTALTWHLGPDVHRRAIRGGYCEADEDRLLESVGWPQHGYGSFEVSRLGGSSGQGWFGPMWESSTLFMRRSLFESLNGYDERFDYPGGGFVNHDLYIRALGHPDTELVVLIGEGSFHQMHGGAMTGATAEEALSKSRSWHRQCRPLSALNWSRRTSKPTTSGTCPRRPWVCWPCRLATP